MPSYTPKERQAVRVRISNFKSIKSTELQLQPGLNVLIGPNGSGKTCLLSALKFIRDVISQGAGLAIAKGGGARRHYHRDTNEISFRIDFSYGNRTLLRRPVPFVLTWEIAISQRGKEQIATIVEESLKLSASIQKKRVDVLTVNVNRRRLKKPEAHVMLESRMRFGKDLFVSPRTRNRASKAQLAQKARRQISEVIKNAKANHDRSWLPSLVFLDHRISEFVQLFFNLNEYNILPDVARQASDQLPIVEMQPNGRNLSEVIYALEQRNFHRLRSQDFMEDNFFYGRPPYWRWRMHHESLHAKGYWGGGMDLSRALSSVKRDLAAAVSPIDNVSVQMDPTSGKRFVVFKAGKYTFYPEEVSDGTIKWLCILVSIYVPFSRVYLLEEPENFLHPWMQQKLIEIMREQASSNKTIFILTSHSATMLNAADLNEIVVVQPTSRGTIATGIRSRAEIRKVLSESNFGLGDLWVSGAIGGVPAQ